MQSEMILFKHGLELIDLMLDEQNPNLGYLFIVGSTPNSRPNVGSLGSDSELDVNDINGKGNMLDIARMSKQDSKSHSGSGSGNHNNSNNGENNTSSRPKRRSKRYAGPHLIDTSSNKQNDVGDQTRGRSQGTTSPVSSPIRNSQTSETGSPRDADNSALNTMGGINVSDGQNDVSLVTTPGANANASASSSPQPPVQMQGQLQAQPRASGKHSRRKGKRQRGQGVSGSGSDNDESKTDINIYT